MPTKNKTKDNKINSFIIFCFSKNNLPTDLQPKIFVSRKKTQLRKKRFKFIDEQSRNRLINIYYNTEYV